MHSFKEWWFHLFVFAFAGASVGGRLQRSAHPGCDGADDSRWPKELPAESEARLWGRSFLFFFLRQGKRKEKSSEKPEMIKGYDVEKNVPIADDNPSKKCILVIFFHVFLCIQAARMIFLRRVVKLSFRDRVRSSVIRGEVGVESLLLCIKRSRLRCFIWFGRLALEMFRAHSNGRRLQGRPGLAGEIMYRLWSENTSGSSSTSWKASLGRRMSEFWPDCG